MDKGTPSVNQKCSSLLSAVCIQSLLVLNGMLKMDVFLGAHVCTIPQVPLESFSVEVKQRDTQCLFCQTALLVPFIHRNQIIHRNHCFYSLINVLFLFPLRPTLKA